MDRRKILLTLHTVFLIAMTAISFDLPNGTRAPTLVYLPVCLSGAVDKYIKCLEALGVDREKLISIESTISDVLEEEIQSVCNNWKAGNECHEQSIAECMQDEFYGRKYRDQIAGLKAIQQFWCEDNGENLVLWSELDIDPIPPEPEVRSKVPGCTFRYNIYCQGLHYDKSLYFKQFNPDLQPFEPPYEIEADLNAFNLNVPGCRNRSNWATCIVNAVKPHSKVGAKFLNYYYIRMLHSYPSCEKNMGTVLPKIPIEPRRISVPSVASLIQLSYLFFGLMTFVSFQIWLQI